MSCLYFFFILISVCQSFEIKKEALPAPYLKKLTSIDPHGFKVEWDPVQSSADQNPVVGYKVKVWEESKIKSYSYITKDGASVLIEEEKAVSSDPFDTFDKKPDSKPIEIVIPRPNETKAQVNDIKFNVEYEIRVLAYTDKEEGPLSKPMKIKLIKKDNSHDQDIYSVS